MGDRGRYDPSILGPADSNGQFELRCGSGGVIIQNGQIDGSEPHGSCRHTYRYSQNAGTALVTRLVQTEALSVLCAHNDWAAWKVASTAGPSAFAKSSADVADVLVVGAGLGGTASAYAAKKAGAENVVIMQAAAASTSSMSTGVVWFPTDHTVAELSEAYGYAGSNSSHVAAYAAGADAAYDYWNDALNLQTYNPIASIGPSFDYTSYSSGEKRGHSYQAAACASSPGDACGAVTVNELKTLSGATVMTGRVYKVEVAANSLFLVSYDKSGGDATAGDEPTDSADAESMLVRTIIFAVGGSGRYENVFSADRILAKSENTGIHLKVANDLGLPLSPTDFQWHLEYQRISGGSAIPRWFAQLCVPANPSGGPVYDVCANYNERSGSFYTGDKTTWHATQETAVSCTDGSAPDTSTEWWRVFFDTLQYSEASGSCTTKEVSAGIIDGKSGFLIEAISMASVSNPQIFSAGTSAAHVLGDTYFSPGSTLGWALYSGRIAGNASAVKAAAIKKTQKVKPTLRKAGLIIAFAAGTWLVLIGILCHMINALKTLHYVIMPAAALILAFAATVARSREAEAGAERPMEAAYKPHVTVGWITVVWLVIQSTWGVLLKSGSWTHLSGRLHRISGWLVLILVAWQYMTSRHGLRFYDVSRNSVTSGSLVYSFLVLVLFVWGVYRIAQRPKAAKPKKTQF